MPRLINADKPHLWKTDIAASVDQFNQWFMRFAPEAFRSTHIETIEHVKATLLATRDLRNIDAATLKDNPSVLSMLRMCTAPPLAVDRLIGLAGVSKNLVGRMEDGKLPTKMNAAELGAELTKLCSILSRLLDRDIFPWLDAAKDPTDHERNRASTIVAGRSCSDVAKDSASSERKMQQLSVLSMYLDSRGYREILTPGKCYYTPSEPGTYTFFATIPAAMGKYAFLPVDALIQPKVQRADGRPVLVQCESYGSFPQARRHCGVHRETWRGLQMTYGDDVPFALMLCGHFGGGYLGTLAADGMDWVWQHRLADLVRLGV